MPKMERHERPGHSVPCKAPTQGYTENGPVRFGIFGIPFKNVKSIKLIRYGI